MLYRIPLAAYSAYCVFLISREETASTLLTGVVGALAATLAVALSLMLYMLDAGEPALRLPLMAASTFAAMFLVRTMALGPVAFLAGFILVLSQTLIDRIPSLEALTRLVLWLWVVVTVPVTLTVLLNLAIGETPARLARRVALDLLGVLARSLRRDDATELDGRLAQAVALIELRQKAGMLAHDLRRRDAIDSTLIEALAELLTVRPMLPAGTPTAARLPIAEILEDCAVALERNDTPPLPRLPDDAVLAGLAPAARPVVVAMSASVARLRDGLSARIAAGGPAAARPRKPMFVPDALRNPAHARFALKTTVAVMAAYLIYSLLDWPGISTAITTCFFVALGSLGETVHKLTLRLSGALIGGLGGGLAIVYLLPEMTNIGQLCLLVAGASVAFGWVATGSDRIAYAGMQMAFAFFLGVLQGDGPATDLTVLRDRAVGILLGNLLMTLVFGVLWPTSAVARSRLSAAAALRALGRLLADADAGRGGAAPGRRPRARRGAPLRGHRRLRIADAAGPRQGAPARHTGPSRRRGFCRRRPAARRRRPRRGSGSRRVACRLRGSACLRKGDGSARRPARPGASARRRADPAPRGGRGAGAAPIGDHPCRYGRNIGARHAPPRCWRRCRSRPAPPTGWRWRRQAPSSHAPSRASRTRRSRHGRPLAGPGSSPSLRQTPWRSIRRASYDLAAIIDLAERSNPDTREAWERARQAALAVGLVEASYAATDFRRDHQRIPAHTAADPDGSDPEGLFHYGHARTAADADGEMAAVRFRPARRGRAGGAGKLFRRQRRAHRRAREADLFGQPHLFRARHRARTAAR